LTAANWELADAVSVDVLRTITIKFLKPRKLGATVESWLKHEAFGVECTAAICLYFLFRWDRTGWSGWMDEKLFFATCERPDRLVGASAAGFSLAVTMAESG
jgi:hypothetical protein